MLEFSQERVSMPHTFSFNFIYKIVTAVSGNYSSAEKKSSVILNKIHAQMTLWSLLVRSKLTQQQLLWCSWSQGKHEDERGRCRHRLLVSSWPQKLLLQKLKMSPNKKPKALCRTENLRDFSMHKINQQTSACLFTHDIWVFPVGFVD